MPRLAGSNPDYSLRFCREIHTEQVGPRGGKRPDLITLEPSETGIDIPSVTTIVKRVWSSTFTQAAYWGYNIALEGVAALDQVPFVKEDLKAILKDTGQDPNQTRNKAAARGTAAHAVLEAEVDDREIEEQDLVTAEGYGTAALSWAQAHRNSVVAAEKLLFNLPKMYCGTADLIMNNNDGTLRVTDAKTHGPSSAKQAAYEEDRIQIAAYCSALEWMWKVPVTRGSVLLLMEDGEYLDEEFDLARYATLWETTLKAYQTLYGEGRVV